MRSLENHQNDGHNLVEKKGLSSKKQEESLFKLFAFMIVYSVRLLVRR